MIFFLLVPLGLLVLVICGVLAIFKTTRPLALYMGLTAAFSGAGSIGLFILAVALASIIGERAGSWTGWLLVAMFLGGGVGGAVWGFLIARKMNRRPPPASTLAAHF